MRKTLIAAALFAFAGAAFAAPVTYKLDPGHTNVLASWNHFGYSNPSINFGQVDGTLVYDADQVSASSVQVTLPLTGLSALADQFYDHLTSDKWFDAAKYPAATFKSTRVEAAGEGKLKVTGDLTIKGITKPVELEAEFNGAATDPFGNARIGFSAETEVEREDWGLTWNAALETGGVLVSKKIKLVLDISAIKQA